MIAILVILVQLLEAASSSSSPAVLQNNTQASDNTRLAVVENQLQLVLAQLHELQTMKQEVCKCDTERDVKRTDTRSGPSNVGFSAQVQDSMDNVRIGTIIKYKQIVYNSGTAYDPNTGIFTCPTSGVYMFSIFVLADHEKKLVVKLVINGNEQVYAISESVTQGYNDLNGNIVIQHVTQGQRVWVETYSVDYTTIFHSFSTFSGVLIRQLE